MKKNLGRANVERDSVALRVLLAQNNANYLSMVSSDDTTPGYLGDKITSADASVAITVANDGADEDFDLSVAVYVAAEIATHTANPDAHHNQSHVLASTSGLGADHTVSGLTARQVLIATGATTALFRTIEDADIPASIARGSEVTAAISAHAANTNAHHNQVHGIVSSDHTVSGAALDVIGLSATNTLAVLTPSAAVTSATAALLRTDSNGRVQVRGLGVNTTAAGDALYVNGDINLVGDKSIVSGSAKMTLTGAAAVIDLDVTTLRVRRMDDTRYRLLITPSSSSVLLRAYDNTAATNLPMVYTAASHTFGGGDVTVSDSLTIITNGDQGDRFLMANTNVSGGSVFYDFNQTDRDAGSTGAFELGFYRDANNITQARMSKEIFEIIIRDGGTYYFPLEVRGQQVILAECPTSDPGIIGAIWRSGGDLRIST